MKNDNSFSYTYSASQQDEIEKIRRKYVFADNNADKMEQLRRLDKSAEKSGMIASTTLGTLSTVFLGIGMCCTMVWTDRWFIFGIIIGIIGIVGMICALPLYNIITKKNRERLAPEIIKLTDELLQK